MTNENDAAAPAQAPNNNPPGSQQLPNVPPSAPKQEEMGTQGNKIPRGDAATANEMRREFRWFEGISLCINGALAIIGIVALCIYAGQLGVMRGQLGQMGQQLQQMQQQTTLMRQQIVGTQAAIFQVITPTWDWVGHKIKFQVVNEGQVQGTIKSLNATVRREKLPERTQIGNTIGITTKDQLIAARQPYTDFLILPWPLRDVSADLWPGKELSIIKGEISYDNGFGDTITQRFCYSWLPPWQLNETSPARGWGGGGWTGGPECRIGAALNEFREVKKTIAEDARMQKR